MVSVRNELVFNDVTFEWDGAGQALFENLALHLDRGWTAVVGANGAGKTTFLRLAGGELEATGGRVRRSEHVVLCEQRTDERPVGFEELATAHDRLARQLCGQLAIGEDWAWRWDSLSHGERKRSQIAVALWKEPHLLAVDEPTNHLDLESRTWLLEALQNYHGVGLIVCHDRAFLDALCSGCLFLRPPAAIYRPGTYTEGVAQEQLEARSAQAEQDKGKAELKRLRRELQRRQQVSEGSKKRLSKRSLRRGDADSRAKVDAARLTGKDKRASLAVKRLRDRADTARDELKTKRVEKERTLGIWIPSARSHRDMLFRLPSGELALGHERSARHPNLVMRPDDRVALVGRNGAGKSSLIRKILEVCNLPQDRVLFLPQELDSGDSASLVTSARELSSEERGRVMTIISRLGSRPDQLIDSDDPSPGELRKLLLALGMAREPHLIVMDEPTNHLDLPSIECLEAALADCPCGLLLVSHDQRFLEMLCQTWWAFDGEPPELVIS